MTITEHYKLLLCCHPAWL